MKKNLITMMLCCLPLLAWAQNITFADANVKAICVANWDTNGDGELSKAEAAAVKELDGFAYNESIKEFTELQFFTGLTSIGYDAFVGCSNLTSIIIPKGVTSIRYGAFVYSGLTSITIPKGVTSIEVGAFAFCHNLANIIVDEGNSVYTSANGANAIIDKASNTLIAGCKNTIIPEGVTEVGEGAFRGCSGLTSITIPESVTSIGWRAFEGCI